MKVDRERLRQSIENIIAEGVFNGEEIDITTRKVMDRIDVLIMVMEDYDDKKANKNPF